MVKVGSLAQKNNPKGMPNGTTYLSDSMASILFDVIEESCTKGPR